jgi:hypothetical protein
MKTNNRQLSILLVLVVVMFATIGCGQTRRRAEIGELRIESESVELGEAESVEVEIDMGAGELEISGGANDLLEADFVYNVDELEPDVDYRSGMLTVSTPNVDIGIGSWWDLDDYRYEWDLYFNDDVPMEMKVEMGAGSADLELGSLSLTRLDIETGAGEVEVDLSDSSFLTRLNLDAGVGSITVDLTGNWQDDLDADISTGVGELTLRLPKSACVRVDVDGGLGEVNSLGLTRDGNDYVNDACGESEVTLRIDINAGVGAITLDVD